MTAWLIKSEPNVYAFSQLVADGKTSWTGVRNYEARNNIRAMKQGDLALYYHSNIGKEIVGVAKIVREAYRDATAPKDEDWSTVDVAPVETLAHAVTLKAIKTNKKLAKMALVKKARISVVPITKEELDEVMKMSKGQTKETR